jgi:hypothetical protein
MRVIVRFQLLFFLLPYFMFGQDSYSKNLMEFSEIVVVGQFTVDISQSNQYKATVNINDPELNKNNVQFNFIGERLTIKYLGASLKPTNIHFEISVPELHHIEVRNGADVNVSKDFSLPSLIALKAMSGGQLFIEGIKSPWVKASISQGGEIQLSGTTSLAEFNVTTGGTISAEYLEAEKVNATVSLGGEILCFANEILHAEVKSGGTIRYRGDAQVSEKIIIGGTIEKLN